MRTVRAFLLGAGVVTVAAYCFSAALAVLVAAAGETARIAVGRLVLVAVERSADGSTTTTFGLGLLLLGLVGGVLNAAVGEILERRRDRREIA